MSLPGLRERTAAVGRLPALGLLTLAGMTPAGWTCSYHETSDGDEAVAEHILQERPTLVALSALTASVQAAYRLSRHLRRARVPVVLGGLHATACADEARRHCDAAVVGEGESVWQELLADAAAGRLKPVYRASRPFDLAGAPVPRFDLLGRQERPRLTVQTQRGCPLACDFCGASRLLGPFRQKPLANVRRELEALRAFGPRPLLELADDNTFAGAGDPGPLLEALAASGVRYFTEADWRLGERADVLGRLAGSGCVQVLVGVESLVFRYPGMGAKHADLTRVMNAVAAIQDAGVAVNGCFIVGCDGEDRASIDRLGDFILASPLADVQLTLQTPFPGTAMYRRLRAQGRLLPGRDWSHYTLFDVTYRPDPLSAEVLGRAFRDLVGRVFSEDAAARRAAIRRRVGQRNPRWHACASEPCSST